MRYNVVPRTGCQLTSSPGRTCAAHSRHQAQICALSAVVCEGSCRAYPCSPARLSTLLQREEPNGEVQWIRFNVRPRRDAI